MRIGIGCDHRGFNLKEKVKSRYENSIDIIDFGTYSEESVDYIDYAKKVCDGINNNQIDYGILMCGTGIGMSIAANKIKGIMCAKVDNIKEAELAKTHNNVNVISISSKHTIDDTFQMIEKFLYSEPLKDEKYKRRIAKIQELE